MTEFHFLSFVIPFIGITVAIVLIVLIVQKYKIRQREFINRERLALIEKEIYEFPGDMGKVDYGKYLFLSLLLIGFGIALIIGSFIEHDYDMITAGAIFIMPGTGTLLFYYIQTRREKDQGQEKSDSLQP